MQIYGEDDLNERMAGAIITAAFPEFRGTRVEMLDEGWDFRVFEVDSGWLFRFPKRETSEAKLNLEYKLLSGLGEWVTLPVPSYKYFCESHENSIWPFAGYRKLPGTGGNTSKMVDHNRVARQLGVFLSSLHSYPVEKARDVGVSEQHDLVAHWQDRSRKQLRGLNAQKLNLDLLHHYLENDTPVSYQGSPSLVHGDLWPLHILVDPSSGGVSGIIDWGDTFIGDPAVDFACLYTWYGKSWVENVLSQYTGKLDEEIIHRSRYLAACMAIHCITIGQELGFVHWINDGYAALGFVFDT